MKLEDAIKHAEEKSGSCECGKEHAQLAKWLKELTALRAIPASAPVSEDRKDAERYRVLKSGDFSVEQFVSSSYGWKFVPMEELDAAIDAAMQEDKP